MIQYTIKLDEIIADCTNCPLRSEVMLHEGLDNYRNERLSGTVAITRKESICNLTKNILTYPHKVGGYRTECPLDIGKEI